MNLSSAEIWLIVGVTLLVIEIFSVSFFALFFGLGALITALVGWMGVVNGIIAELLFFAAISLAMLLLFRKKLLEMFHRRGEEFHEFVGQRVLVSEAITPNREGKVQFRGSDWIAYSADNETFEPNQLVRIKSVDGIKLEVESNA